MTYDGATFEVEFAGPDGRAYALLPLAVNKLMVLRDTPEEAAASPESRLKKHSRNVSLSNDVTREGNRLR
jgi:hypothetical protein